MEHIAKLDETASPANARDGKAHATPAAQAVPAGTQAMCSLPRADEDIRWIHRRQQRRPERARADHPCADRSERRGQDDLFQPAPASSCSPSAGRIYYQGSDITRAAPEDIAGRGLVRSFQISAIFPRLTLGENVRVALQRKLGTSWHFWKPLASLRVLDEHVDRLLESVGLAERRDEPAGLLSYGRKARAGACNDVGAGAGGAAAR